MTVILARALLLGQLVLAAAALHDEPRAAVADRGFPSGSTTCWWSCPPVINGWAWSSRTDAVDYAICQYNIPFPPGGTLTCHYFAEFGTLYENPSGPQCQMVPQAPFAGCGPDFAPSPGNPNFKKRKLRRGAKRGAKQNVQRDVLVH